MTVTVFGTVLVVLVVLVIVLVSVTGGKNKTSGSSYGMKPASASVVNAIAGVSPSAFAAAGSVAAAYGPYITGMI